MGSFKQYLEEKRLAPASQTTYLRSLARMMAYFDDPLASLDTATVQGYITYLQQLGKAKRYINEELRALRHYYNYLIESGELAQNPAQHLFLRGVSRPRALDILGPQELRESLDQYQKAYPKDFLRQTALSLMVYQGVATTDLLGLEARHIDLEKAEVHLVGSVRTAPRKLLLSAPQVLLLQAYLDKVEGALFPSARPLGNRLGHLFRKQLPPLPPPAGRIYKAHQIRASVISHWLKGEDIRRVQYKAGHRYISSTEAYQNQDLEELKEQLLKYHPLAQKL